MSKWKTDNPVKHSLHVRMVRAVGDAEGAVTACSEERDRPKPLGQNSAFSIKDAVNCIVQGC